MFRCGTCDTGFDKCTCPDIDERLKKLAWMKNGMVAFKWCRTCDKHYARCQCKMPDFYLVKGGEEIKERVFRTLDGGVAIPNMNER